MEIRTQNIGVKVELPKETFACSKSTIVTIEKSMKYVQS